MPKLKDVQDLDVEALDAVEYSTEEFTTYTGDVPPVGTELTGYVKRMWWTRTAPKQGGGGDDPMIKVLWVAAENEGDLEEFNDCPFWLNAPLVPGAKFRWAPFLDVYGLTLRQLKTNTYVASKEDQNGAPIERIGQWRPGEDRDESWCRIISGEEPYNGVMQARVKEWLMWDAEGEPGSGADGEGEEDGEGVEPDDDGEGVELFEDADGNLVDEEGNYYNEDGTPMEDPEEVVEPEPEPAPARARRAAKAPAAAPARAARTASTAPARASRTAPATKPARTAPATTRTRTAAPRAATATATKPTRSSGRGRAAAAQNDPPF